MASELNVVVNNLDDGVIDLTDDEPPEKKIILQTENFANQTSVSEQILRGGCYICGDSVSRLIYLRCKHRFCYKHFVVNLQQMKEHTNACFISECKQPIPDEIIKDRLMPLDYISFLELSRDNLRKVIQQKNIQIKSPAELNAIPDLDAGKFSQNVLEESTSKTIDDAKLDGFNERHSEFLNLQNLETMSYIKNFEPFQCPICFVDYQVQEGLILETCLHSFCIECISATVRYSDEPRVLCPFISENGACKCFIQEREIRGIVSPEIYELHLRKGLKRAEANLDNIYHCKTPDCDGFIQYQKVVRAFVCPACDKINCVKCKAIHEEKTCAEYKLDLKIDAKNHKDLKMTDNALKRMQQRGQAMQCPNCKILIQKNGGCDHMVCASCKLSFSYHTKKPRHPLRKMVNGVLTIIGG